MAAEPTGLNPAAQETTAVQALNFVKPGEDAETRNIVLYSGPGVGKSVQMMTAPGPILVLNAEGVGGLKKSRQMFGNDHIAELPVTGIADLRAAAIAIKADAGKTWPTVGLDTIGEIYRVLVEEQAGPGKMPEVQHYGNAGTELERFVRMLRDQPVNVVILAHEELIDGPNGPIMVPSCGGKKLGPKVCAMVDHVGYLGIDPGTGDNPVRRWMAQLAPSPKRTAKDRGNTLGTVRECNLAEWIATATGKTPAADNSTGKKAA